MSEHLPSITITLAVPQASPEQLHDALGDGYTLDEQGLHDPDGRRYEVVALPQDHEFADIVVGGATHAPRDEEVAAMRAAPTLLKVTGPGGSLDAAAAMLRVGAALVETGAAGILCDNSGLGHGGHDWRTLAHDADDGGTHWAFVASNRDHDGKWTGHDEPVLFTMGMHCLGHREVVVPMTGDDEADWFHLNNTCGYLERSGRVPVDGDVLTAMAEDEDGTPKVVPMFRVRFEACAHVPPDHPMHNPFGVIRLEVLDPDDPRSMDWRPSGKA
ncbi:MAG: hypothetical protein GVY24_02690 [Planctomycetes bacterium]|jgi:hypothetical protein|nr:hypothetical protein [Planctomycetota bacterium]